MLRAYGWTVNLTTEQVLEHVVALNTQRRAEEGSGLVRWLRPEFQAPNAAPIQAALDELLPGEVPATVRRKQPWPATLTDQVRAIKDALRATPFSDSQQIASGRRVVPVLQRYLKRSQLLVKLARSKKKYSL